MDTQSCFCCKSDCSLEDLNLCVICRKGFCTRCPTKLETLLGFLERGGSSWTPRFCFVGKLFVFWRCVIHADTVILFL
jgi:hypothetical protein